MLKLDEEEYRPAYLELLEERGLDAIREEPEGIAETAGNRGLVRSASKTCRSRGCGVTGEWRRSGLRSRPARPSRSWPATRPRRRGGRSGRTRVSCSENIAPYNNSLTSQLSHIITQPTPAACGGGIDLHIDASCRMFFYGRMQFGGCHPLPLYARREQKKYTSNTTPPPQEQATTMTTTDFTDSDKATMADLFLAGTTMRLAAGSGPTGTGVWGILNAQGVDLKAGKVSDKAARKPRKPAAPAADDAANDRLIASLNQVPAGQRTGRPVRGRQAAAARSVADRPEQAGQRRDARPGGQAGHQGLLRQAQPEVPPRHGRHGGSPDDRQRMLPGFPQAPRIPLIPTFHKETRRTT